MNEWIGADIEDLALFAQVVERGSFTAAAQHIAVPQSTISRRILALESRLGARLLDRTTRSIHLTEIGRRTYDHVRVMLAEAQAARNAVDVLTLAPRGVLRVAAPVLLGRSPLPQIVTRYLSLNREVSMTLEFTTRNLDPVEDDVDIAIRVDVPEKSRAWVEPIYVGSLGLYAAPSAIHPAAPPAPDHPADVAGLEIFGVARGSLSQVLTFTKGEDSIAVPVALRLRANDIFAVIEAARACPVYALLPDFSVPEGWTQVCPDWSLPPYHLVALATRHGRSLPRVALFLEALKDGMARMGPRSIT